MKSFYGFICEMNRFRVMTNGNGSLTLFPTRRNDLFYTDRENPEIFSPVHDSINISSGKVLIQWWT